VTVEDVVRHVKELEERVAALERLAAKPVPEPVMAVSETNPGTGASPIQPGFSVTSGTLATVARVLLGFAGAYLLRAIAESGSIPQSVGIVAGLAYAFFWLAWSARLKDRAGIILYGLTSTCIFAGLIWENAVQVHALPSSFSASLIAMFSYAGLGLAWRRNLPEIGAIVTIGGATIALELVVATHDVVPFTAALLSIAAASEFAAGSGRWLGHRWCPSLAADLALFIVAWVITQPQGVPENYPPFGVSSVVALQMISVLIYALGMGYRTLVTGSAITSFEIGQNAIAIGLFIWVSVMMGHQAPAARLVVEVFCLLAGLSCYATAVLLLARQSRQRNFLLYGIFGLALVISGIAILFSGGWQVSVCCILAVVVSWLGTHEHRFSLQLHAPVFLGVAALGSGLLDFAQEAMHGANSPTGSHLALIVVVTIALSLCYFMTGQGEAGKARIPALLIAALLCWALLGLGAAGITALLGVGSTMSSTLRNGLISALALVLARHGVRRPELNWLVYPLMLYGAYRLLSVEFPHGSPTALALSLLFYGGTLLQLTRMVRGDKAAAS